MEIHLDGVVVVAAAVVDGSVAAVVAEPESVVDFDFGFGFGFDFVVDFDFGFDFVVEPEVVAGVGFVGFVEILLGAVAAWP